MRKKGIIVAGVVCLAFGSVLAGCSDEEKADGTPTPSSTANNTGQTMAPKGQEETKPKVRQKISTSIYDMGRVPASEGTTENNRWTKWMSENGPHDVKFVAIPRWESEQKFNTLFASGSAPDLLFEFSPWIKNTWYIQKQLLPLDDLIENHSTEYKQLMQKYPILKQAGTLSDGKLYYMGRLNEVSPLRAIFIRKDWLNTLNLDIPKTTEELYQVAEAFAKQDPDNNGKDDTYGMAVSGDGSGRTINQMFQNMGFVLRNDEIVYAWDSFGEAARFLKRMYDGGIIDKDYYTDSNGERAKQAFINGKVGIYPTLLQWRSFAVNEYKALLENVPEAELIPIPLPESPAGAFNPTLNNPIQMTASINRAAKNPEAVMEFVDFLVKPSTRDTLGYGIEGVHHVVKENGCPQKLEGEHSKELGYNINMMSNSSFVLEGKCGTASTFNTDIPIEKKGLELYNLGVEAYMDLNRPYAEITHSEHEPQLPKELQVTMSQTYLTIGQLYSRSIVSGPDYTVEQMLKEVKEVWEKGKGPEAEAWWQQWYKENKDTAFLAEDIYDIVREQQKMKK